MKNKKNILLSITTIAFLLFIILFFTYAFYQKNIVADKYEKAQEYLNEGKFDAAIEILSTIQDYKDSNNMKHLAEQELIYAEAIELLNENEYAEAINKFMQIENYKDSADQITEAQYNLALKYYEIEDYDSAKKILIELNDYSDSKFYLAQIDIKNIEQSQKVVYEKAILQLEAENYEEALELFKTIVDYEDAEKLAEKCQLQLIRKNPNNILAGGIRCSAAIADNGTVLASGANLEGQCDVENWKNIISIDTYGCFTVGLTDSGEVKLAGKYDGKKVDTSSWNGIIDVATGERFVVGLKNDGTVIADGHNREHQIDVSEWKNVIAIDAGWNFTVALTEDKQLLFAGVDNGQKEQFNLNSEEWKNVINIAAGGGGNTSKQRGKGHTVGLKSDGTVVAVGDNTFGQCEVENWKNIIKVAAGDWYTVGLQKDGIIVITGSNTSGSMYINDEILMECTDVVDIAAGFGHTLCLNADGTVTSFGFDDDNKVTSTSKWKNLMLPQFYN